MHIRPASVEDIPTIETLYREAIAFQRKGGHPSWQDLDLTVVENDIAGRCQYALVVGTLQHQVIYSADVGLAGSVQALVGLLVELQAPG
jgi:hypothetical protein